MLVAEIGTVVYLACGLVVVGFCALWVAGMCGAAKRGDEQMVEPARRANGDELMRGVDLEDYYGLGRDEIEVDPWDDPVKPEVEPEDDTPCPGPERCRCCTRPLLDEHRYFCAQCLADPEHAGAEMVSGQIVDRYRSVLP